MVGSPVDSQAVFPVQRTEVSNLVLAAASAHICQVFQHGLILHADFGLGEAGRQPQVVLKELLHGADTGTGTLDRKSVV